MESQHTLETLAILFRATPQELNCIRRLNEATLNEHGHHLSVSVIFAAFRFTTLDEFENLILPNNDTRQQALEDFVANLRPDLIEWINEVKDVFWHESDCKSLSMQLFVAAESHHISSVASFAIISAAMALQGFPRPRDLNRILWGAAKNVQDNRAKTRNAEERREAELKGEA